MKVLIFKDEDARPLIEKLELEKYRAKDRSQEDSTRIAEVHRWFHYHVVKWLQDRGADVTEK